LGRLFRVHGLGHVKTGRQIDANGTITNGEQSAGTAVEIQRSMQEIIANLGALKAGQLDQIQQLPPYLLDHTPRRYAVRVWNDLPGN
jgi:hypothetical protein